MGMNIEVVGRMTYTVKLTGEDVQKVKDYVNSHEEDFAYITDKEKICGAVRILYGLGEISFYDDGKFVETDYITEEINWSEFENSEAEQILQGSFEPCK